MNATTIANILAQRIAPSINTRADQRDALKTIHRLGAYHVGELTNHRTLVTLFSLVEAGLVEHSEYTFTLTQSGKDMMERVTK